MELRLNRVRQKLEAGEPAFVVGGVTHADDIDALGPIGFDGIWLEGEHGGVDAADLGNLTRACDIWGMTSLVRVNRNEQSLIYRTLDRGAQAIVVPHVDTRADAENVVAGGKFPPLGKRGLFTSRQGYGVDDYLARANDETLLIALIEDIEAWRQPRRDSRSRRHRRVLRRAVGFRGVDGPHRQRRPSRRAGEDRGFPAPHRRRRPDCRHAVHERQRSTFRRNRRQVLLHGDGTLGGRRCQRFQGERVEGSSLAISKLARRLLSIAASRWSIRSPLTNLPFRRRDSNCRSALAQACCSSVRWIEDLTVTEASCESPYCIHEEGLGDTRIPHT